MAQAPGFSMAIWLVLALIGGSSVLAMLYGMAVVARAHMQVHDMRVKVAKLRKRYAAELSGEHDGILEVEPIDEVAPAPVVPLENAA